MAAPQDSLPRPKASQTRRVVSGVPLRCADLSPPNGGGGTSLQGESMAPTPGGTPEADPESRRGGRMRRSYHLAVDQESLQRNWSLYREERHRDYSTKPPTGAKLVHWGPPVAIRCAHCRHMLGS